MSNPPHDAAVDQAHCYRHPDQPTLVSCSSCERPICPACMVPSPVGMRCPECVHGPVQTRPHAAPRPRRSATRSGTAGLSLTVTLIIINVIVFAWEVRAAGGTQVADSRLLYDLGGIFGPAVADGQWWRLITGGFLHAGLLHIMLNMWALWVLGSILEDAVGPSSMGLMYAAAVVWGSAGAVLLDPNVVTVGASGGVFGLMGALIVLARIRGARELMSSLMLVLGVNILITFTIPGISVGGHLGGLIGGVVAALVLVRVEPRSRRAVVPAAAVIVLIMGGLAVGILSASGGLPSLAMDPSGFASVVGVLGA